MKIYLQNVDVNQLIDIESGNSITIGRKDMIECTDKRVSRKHVTLSNIGSGSLKALALNVNPCFYMKEGLPPVLIVSKDEEVVLSNGDYISLLPDKLWFKIVVEGQDEDQDISNLLSCNKQTDKLSPVKNTEFTAHPNRAGLERLEANTTPQKTTSSELCISQSTPKQSSPSIPKQLSRSTSKESSISVPRSPIPPTSKQPSLSTTKEPSSLLQSSPLPSTSKPPSPSTRRLPLWMYQIDEPADTQSVSQNKPVPSSSTLPVTINEKNKDPVEGSSKAEANLPVQTSSRESENIVQGLSEILKTEMANPNLNENTDESNKSDCQTSKTSENPPEPCSRISESASMDPGSSNTRNDGVNPSTDSVTVKTEPVDEAMGVEVKTEVDEGAGSSNKKDKEGYESDVGQPGNSNNGQLPPRRPICQYEGRCYRKNLQHKEDFSHPGDPDFIEEANRPWCPYGVTCYRQNVLHRVEYRHIAPPASRPQGVYAQPTSALGESHPPCPYGGLCFRGNPDHRRMFAHPPLWSNTTGLFPRYNFTMPTSWGSSDQQQSTASRSPSQSPTTSPPTSPLPAKRRRKQVQTAKDSSDEDDYDLEDPFINDDSSDEYNPSNSEEESDLSQSQSQHDTQEEQVNVKRLKKEANKFINGRKRK